MKRFKKIMKVVIATVLCMSIAAVSTPAAQAKELTVNEIVQQTNKKNAGLKSYQMSSKLNMTVSMEYLGTKETLAMNMTQELIYFKSPLKIKITTTVKSKDGTTGREDKTVDEQYLGSDGKQYFMYQKANDKWSKSAISKDTFGNATEQGMDLFGKGVKYKLVSSNEKVGSKTAYLIQGSVSAELLTDAMGLLDESIATPKKGDLFTIKYWVDKKTMYPIKASVDMTDFMNSVMNESLKSSMGEEAADMIKVKIPKCVYEITYKNINQAKNFTLPK